MKKKKTAKKTKKMQQTHGKVETFQPTTLDQVWGDDGTGKYSTNDEKTGRLSISVVKIKFGFVLFLYC